MTSAIRISEENSSKLAEAGFKIDPVLFGRDWYALSAHVNRKGVILYKTMFPRFVVAKFYHDVDFDSLQSDWSTIIPRDRSNERRLTYI